MGSVGEVPAEISFQGMHISFSIELLLFEFESWKWTAVLKNSDFLGLNTCLYEWADSYDSKDWDRLRKCNAPTLRVRPPMPSLSLPI
jgi:hypothetical protein